MKQYEFLRVDKEAGEKIKHLKEYLQKTKGGKWTTSKVINYLLSNNGTSLSDKVISKFDEFKAEIEVLLKIHQFSKTHINYILEEIGVFEAFLLQQINGHLDPPFAKHMLEKFPTMVNREMEIHKNRAMKKTNEIFKATPEVPP